MLWAAWCDVRVTWQMTFYFIVSCLYHCPHWPCSANMFMHNIHVSGAVWHDAIEELHEHGRSKNKLLLLEKTNIFYVICCLWNVRRWQKNILPVAVITLLCLKSSIVSICVCVNGCLFSKESEKSWKLMNSSSSRRDCFHLNCLTNKLTTLEEWDFNSFNHTASIYPLDLCIVWYNTYRVK